MCTTQMIKCIPAGRTFTGNSAKIQTGKGGTSRVVQAGGLGGTLVHLFLTLKFGAYAGAIIKNVHVRKEACNANALLAQLKKSPPVSFSHH